MATLTISNIDADAIQRLQVGAEENGHPLEEEARRILYAALGCQSTPNDADIDPPPQEPKFRLPSLDGDGNGTRKKLSFEELDDDTIMRLIKEADQNGITRYELAGRLLNDALDCEPKPLSTSETISKIFGPGGGVDLFPSCEPEHDTPIFG